MDLQQSINDLNGMITKLLPESGLNTEQRMQISSIMNGTAKATTILKGVDLTDSNLTSQLKEVTEMQAKHEEMYNNLKDGISRS